MLVPRPDLLPPHLPPVSGLFTISVYDVLLQLAGLPFLPRVFPSDLYALTAAQVLAAAPHVRQGSSSSPLAL